MNESYEYKLRKLSNIIKIHTNSIKFGEYLLCANVDKPAYFDCRVFQLPIDEVVNYFIWRQSDARTNSIQMLARSNFSHKECMYKSISDLQDMLLTKEINWNNQLIEYKRGWCLYNGFIDCDIPLFTENSGFVENNVLKINGVNNENI